MFMLEALGYTITVAYNMRRGNPFSTYGENAIIWFQNMILITMMYYYSKKLNATFFSIVAGYAAFCAVLFSGRNSGLVSDEMLAGLQVLTIPISTSSKIPQIWTTHKLKSTGQLAFVTTLLNFLGVVARTFTLFREAPDPILLIGILCAAFLNGIMLLQFFIYAPKNAASAPTAAASTASTSAPAGGATHAPSVHQSEAAPTSPPSGSTSS